MVSQGMPKGGQTGTSPAHDFLVDRGRSTRPDSYPEEFTANLCPRI